MKKTFALMFALMAVFLFAACETNPPTNVGATTATLNGQGHCTSGVSMWFTYELNQLGVNNGWFNVGPSQYVNCTADTAESAINPHPVGGLAQNTDYYQRLLVYVYNNGVWEHYDSVGTKNGSNFDIVDTEEDVGEVNAASGVMNESTGAIASVEADYACEWWHKSRWNYYRSDIPPRSRGGIRCNFPPDVTTTCHVSLYTENTVHQGSDGTADQRCEIVKTGAPYVRGKYAVLDFSATLLNKKLSWIRMFSRIHGLECNRFRNSRNLATMHCTRTGYAPWYSRLIG